MQWTRVQALVREDPTCRGATDLMHHSYWLRLRSRAQEPQLLSLRATATEAHMPRVHAPQQREATAARSPHTAKKSGPRSPQLEKSPRAATKTQRSQKINK